MGRLDVGLEEDVEGKKGFFQAEGDMRDSVASRGLGDMYERQSLSGPAIGLSVSPACKSCSLYTSDAADDTPCVDLGGCRFIKNKT